MLFYSHKAVYNSIFVLNALGIHLLLELSEFVIQFDRGGRFLANQFTVETVESVH